ncbi:phosphatidylcholine translocator ABCB4-like isoform X1 [Bacillus rossius redtenbacheri]|uniref:phosphatidylcholine translocator ABCB4-like isoform X1 n=1 Tax=Bacillus rossius redtenbacheri TaxID=93214 RepID=UPI002FDD8621
MKSKTMKFKNKESLENAGLGVITKKMKRISDYGSVRKASGVKSQTGTDDDLEPVSFLSLYRFSTAGQRCLLLAGLAAGLAGGALTVANMALLAGLTDELVRHGNATLHGGPGDQLLHALQGFALGNAAVGAGVLLLGYLSVCLFNHVAAQQIYMIRCKFFESALHQDIGWYDVRQTGDLASRMAEDLNKLEDGFGEKVVMFANFVANSVASVVFAFVRGWELTLVCLASTPVILIVVVLIMWEISRLSKKELKAYGKAGAIAEEALGSIRTVFAFGGESQEVKRYRANLVFAKKISVKRGFYMGAAFGVIWFFIYAAYALAFWYGVGLVLDQRHWPQDEIVYTPGTMIVVFFCVMQGCMNVGAASPYLEAFGVARAAAAKVFSVIDRVPAIYSLSEHGSKLPQLRGSLTFRNVHFEYPSRPGVKVLDGVDLTLAPGQKVALVGSSGCGKSTCVQLIQRFYDPTEGQVLLDGTDVAGLNVSWLRAQVGVVGQEPVLFNMSIEENIRLGHATASKADVMQAARDANAHSFICGLPQGYDTVVGEKGAQLSGGQRQRIAIARALVRQPRILLLDEATSALDSGSEASVQLAMDKASQGRTTLVVAHRLSTVRGADRIVVMAGGRVVEEGTHAQLMSLQGHYCSLVASQVDHHNHRPGAGGGDGDRDSLLEEMLALGIEVPGLGDRRPEPSAPEPPEPPGPSPPSLADVLSLGRPEWPLLVVGGACAVVMGCSYPAFAVLFGDILQLLGLEDPVEVRDKTNMFCIYFLAAAVVIGVSSFIQVAATTVAGEKLTARLRARLFAAMLRQEVAWFDHQDNSPGTLCARLSSDASQVQGATGQRVSLLVQSLSTLLVGVALAMYYEWRLGLVALSFCPVVILAQYLFGLLLSGTLLRDRAALQSAVNVAVEAVGSIRTVAGLGQQRLFLDRFASRLQPTRDLALRYAHLRGAVCGLASSVLFFGFAATMYYGGRLVQWEGLAYGSVFKISQMLLIGTASIGASISFAPNFQRGLVAAGNIFQILHRKPRLTDPSTEKKNWVAEGRVEFSRVGFSYPGRPTAQVLDDVSLGAEPGRTIALVGPSGCGKSTCLQLLQRFYEPTSGSVTLDRQDVSSVPLRGLRQQLGVVSQEPVLFDRTVADNIAYGDNTRRVPHSEVIAAAKLANIHGFIASLPLGYETRLGEKGMQLSGGQKQRVAIARALVRNPRVLLLDEATSALDADSEKVVQEALDKARACRTCVVIAHRLSTIKDSDCIYVIADGRVAERGSHSELMSLDGTYRKLYSLQQSPD